MGALLLRIEIMIIYISIEEDIVAERRQVSCFKKSILNVPK